MISLGPMKKLSLLLFAIIFAHNSIVFSLPANTMDLFLRQDLSEEAIAAELLKEPHLFEQNIKKLAEQMNPQSLSPDQIQKIQKLEESINSAAIKYNQSQKNKYLLIKIAGAVVGAAVIGYSSKVASEKVFSAQSAGGNFASVMIAAYAPAFIVGVSVLGGGTVGYFATKTYLNKDKLNEKSKILD